MNNTNKLMEALKEQSNLFTKIREVITSLPNDKLQLLISRVISVYIESLRVCEGIDVHVYKALLVAYVDMIQAVLFSALNSVLFLTDEEEAVIKQAAAILGPKFSHIASVYMQNIEKITALLDTTLDVATLDEGFEQAAENLNQSVQELVEEFGPYFSSQLN